MKWISNWLGNTQCKKTGHKISIHTAVFFLFRVPHPHTHVFSSKTVLSHPCCSQLAEYLSTGQDCNGDGLCSFPEFVTTPTTAFCFSKFFAVVPVTLYLHFQAVKPEQDWWEACMETCLLPQFHCSFHIPTQKPKGALGLPGDTEALGLMEILLGPLKPGESCTFAVFC